MLNNWYLIDRTRLVHHNQQSSPDLLTNPNFENHEKRRTRHTSLAESKDILSVTFPASGTTRVQSVLRTISARLAISMVVSPVLLHYTF